MSGIRLTLSKPQAAVSKLKPSIFSQSEENKSNGKGSEKVKNNIFNKEEEDTADKKAANYVLLQAQAYQAKRAEEMKQTAMESDPNAFSYDEVYDSMQDTKMKKEEKIVEEKEKRESKYISTLLKHAEKRKIEHDIMFDKKSIKERKLEDSVYGDKPKYITSGYKDKLKEQEKWLLEQERIEKEEAASLLKRSNDGFFGSSLLQNLLGSTPAPSVKVDGKSKESSIITSTKSEHVVPENSSKSSALSNHSLNDKKEIDERETAAIPLAGPAAVIVEPVPTVEEKSIPAPTIEEKALSARERYLQRKLQATSNNNDIK